MLLSSWKGYCPHQSMNSQPRAQLMIVKSRVRYHSAIHYGVIVIWKYCYKENGNILTQEHINLFPIVFWRQSVSILVVGFLFFSNFWRVTKVSLYLTEERASFVLPFCVERNDTIWRRLMEADEGAKNTRPLSKADGYAGWPIRVFPSCESLHPYLGT